jgi:hypothetical protein
MENLVRLSDRLAILLLLEKFVKVFGSDHLRLFSHYSIGCF